jgi:hypothetical protein
MKFLYLLSFSRISIRPNRFSLIFLVTVGLLMSAGSYLIAQSVAFTSAPTLLPVAGVDYFTAMAVDSSGDVFIADGGPERKVVELPRTATGYGPQLTLPTGILETPLAVAADNLGNVFIADEDLGILEMQKTSNGYGSPLVLTSPVAH